MTATPHASSPLPTRLSVRLINALLSIKPLAQFAKHQARSMMIKRASTIGVDWIAEAKALQAAGLEAELEQIQDPNLTYPDYYLRPFHAYEQGNLSWDSATEVEVAAYAVHARIWPDTGAEGDARLRQSYHQVLQNQLPTPPTTILDLACSVGMSTFALHTTYPNADLTGLDLSPYFLAVAHHRSRQNQIPVRWIHAPAESTGLTDQSFDLVSACLLFHELPQDTAHQILQEARRLLKPGGYLAIMDMNPQSSVYATMSPAILTLLKSTEPYLDQYFNLDLEQAIQAAGFDRPSLSLNSPRHRVLIARAA